MIRRKPMQQMEDLDQLWIERAVSYFSKDEAKSGHELGNNIACLDRPGNQLEVHPLSIRPITEQGGPVCRSLSFGPTLNRLWTHWASDKQGLSGGLHTNQGIKEPAIKGPKTIKEEQHLQNKETFKAEIAGLISGVQFISQLIWD